MTTKLQFPIALIILILIMSISCSSIPKNFKEKTLDDMYPILSNKEYQEIQTINNDKEILKWLDSYWNNREKESGDINIRLRSEYEKRLEYANKHFPDRRGWGRSDRKRIYLLYGPPSYIEKKEDTDIHISQFSIIKSMEIWFYMMPGNNDALPSQGDDIYLGEMKFIFADMTGSGVYKTLYSSEDSEYFDSRILNQQQN